MSTKTKSTSKLWLAGAALIGFGSSACLKDDVEPEAAAGSSTTSGGTGGSTGGGAGGKAEASAGTTASGGKAGGTSTSGAVCAAPIALSSDQGMIATFDDYDGAAALKDWSFALGGDAATGVFSGPFGYGDDTGGVPEVFEMTEGNASTYGLSISDTMSADYGGGLGLWLSECLDVTAFSGVSLWVRGDAPTGEVKLSLLMEETTSETPAKADSKAGTCAGTDEECLHPSAMVPVTGEWAEVRVAWADFMHGSAAGNPIAADGSNVWQLQIDVGLEWVPDDAGVYQPTPGAYELAIDDVAFF